MSDKKNRHNKVSKENGNKTFPVRVDGGITERRKNMAEA